MNTLYYGDNLDILRHYVKDESVDLVYLDPPFNSNADYNVLFAEQDGLSSSAQIKAFEDTWRWDEAAAVSYEEVVVAGGRVSQAMQAFRQLLGTGDMLAYLSMMAPRLMELHRVLKPTGSLYLHCDPTAGHYLKVLMDAIFGPRNFRREVVWRSGWVSGFKTKTRNWIRNHDVLLYYLKDRKADWTFNKDKAYRPHAEGYERRGGGENPKGVAIDDVWDEVPLYSPWIKSFSQEKLGYATQKPKALLERIIDVSSNPGDTVLDPFCGCGTTIDAAQELGRNWIGIDITHLAVNLIRYRLRDAYGPSVVSTYRVIGEPTSLPDAQALAEEDKYQFQWWALGLVGARPAEERKGADEGIDGRLYFHDEGPDGDTKQIIFSVKAGRHIGVAMVRDLGHVVNRENAQIGVLISMAEPTGAMRREVAGAGFYESPWDGKRYPRLQLRTVQELLEGKGVQYPALTGGNRTFKKATAKRSARQESMLDFGERS